MAKGRQRTQKWYFQNEEEVMRSLGLEPTKGSGSGWVEKEDGQNDHVIAQLKSTDKQSYKLNHLDLAKLEYNAMVAKKIPMFILQFLSNNDQYALVNINDIPALAEYIKTGKIEENKNADIVDLSDDDEDEWSPPVVKSSAKARNKFNREKQKAWEERKWRK